VLSTSLKKSSWNISTKSSRLSYALGIVQGISKDIEKNIRIEKEQRQRKLDRARLADSRGEAYQESDDEDNDIGSGNTPGFSLCMNDEKNNSGNNKSDDIHLNSMSRVGCDVEDIDSKRTLISGIDLQRRVEELEKEQQAALVLVDHNKKIAEEVLIEHDIKLKKGRKRKAIDFDCRSYNQGIEDSKEIDMNQRAIRDEIKVKSEKK